MPSARIVFILVGSVCCCYMLLLLSGSSSEADVVEVAASLQAGATRTATVRASDADRGPLPPLQPPNGRSSGNSAKDVTLPNGGPGNSASLTMDSVRRDFIPLDTRRSTAALPAIYDSITVTGIKFQTDAAGPSAFSLHLATLLGRTRLTATLRGETLHDVDLADMRSALFRHAPAWYVGNYTWLRDDNEAEIILRRRLNMFVFCIAGGSDGRASYVEYTWGQRTPIQWFADEWSADLRPIVDLHPLYLKDRFNLLTFKISRIWQRVFLDFGGGGAGPAPYDWYVRLWDDNYFHEEFAYNSLGRLDPTQTLMAGKIGWRNMGPKDAVFPFAGGGAGWFLAEAGLRTLGPSVPDAEKWFFEFRARRDIFLPHAIHDEDVFLTAWLHKLNTTFVNIPGVEHVSPGLKQKQRCLRDEQLYKLRWDPSETIYFDYPAREAVFRIEEAWYAYSKPIVWHYMSPTRLVKLESTLYPERRPFLDTLKPPATAADIAKPRRQCYPGVPDGPPPARGKSLFEQPLSDPLTWMHQPD